MIGTLPRLQRQLPTAAMMPTSRSHGNVGSIHLRIPGNGPWECASSCTEHSGLNEDGASLNVPRPPTLRAKLLCQDPTILVGMLAQAFP
jgi:hypothetical protein